MLKLHSTSTLKQLEVVKKHEKNTAAYKLHIQECKVLISTAKTYQQDIIVSRIVNGVSILNKFAHGLTQRIAILETCFNARFSVLKQELVFFEAIEVFQRNLEIVGNVYTEELFDDRNKALKAMDKLATARIKTGQNLSATLTKGRVLLKLLRSSRTTGGFCKIETKRAGYNLT